MGRNYSKYLYMAWGGASVGTILGSPIELGVGVSVGTTFGSHTWLVTEDDCKLCFGNVGVSVRCMIVAISMKALV